MVCCVCIPLFIYFICFPPPPSHVHLPSLPHCYFFFCFLACSILEWNSPPLRSITVILHPSSPSVYLVTPLAWLWFPSLPLFLSPALDIGRCVAEAAVRYRWGGGGQQKILFVAIFSSPLVTAVCSRSLGLVIPQLVNHKQLWHR